MEASHGKAEGAPGTRAWSTPRVRARLSLKVQRRWLLTGLVALDAVALAAAFACAYALRFYSDLPVFREVIPAPGTYLPLATVMVGVWLLLFGLVGLYDENNLLGGTREYALVLQACTFGTLVAVLVSFLVETLFISRGLVMLNWLFTFLFVAGSRFWFRRAVYRMRRRGYFLSTAAIVGANEEGIALAEQLDVWAASGMRLVGFFDEDLPVGSPVYNGLKVLGACADLPALVEDRRIEQLVIASSGVPREGVLEIVQTLGMSPRVNIHFSSGVFEILTTGVRVRERAYVPLISLNQVRLTGIDRFLKAVLDVGGAIACLVLLSPLLVVLALLVRLDSPGPVLYRRRALGLHGREFDALKFRTMYFNWEGTIENEDVRDQFVVGAKPRNDPRLTRLGRFLRRWSLDELPQLVNVLRRDMSLVGPRMITREESAFYHKWQMNLLTLRPGMTGLWQVSGRAEVNYEEKVRLDMYYIRNYSIWLDLQILLRTLSVVINGKGAR